MTDMQLTNILQIEGITIRLIPKETVSLFAYRDGQKLTEGQSLIDHGGRQMVREVKRNALGGKYLVRVTPGQGSMVQFSKDRDGIGETIETAYADYIAKVNRP